MKKDHQFLCRNCAREISAPPAAVGQKTRCCLCEAVIVVPTAEQDSQFRVELQRRNEAARVQKEREAAEKRATREQDKETLRQRQEEEKEARRRKEEEDLKKLEEAYPRFFGQEKEVAARERELQARQATGFVCSNCGTYNAEPARPFPGSGAVEIVLWLWLIIPGLLYTIWRHQNRRYVCRSCGSTGLIPADSPKGRELLASSASAQTAIRRPRE